MARSGIDDLNSTDERLLAYLAADGPDYPALIASNTGLYVGNVERRVETLREQGLVEDVSGEVIYRITADGRSVLADAGSGQPLTDGGE